LNALDSALDSALVKLYASISALEHHAPTTADVETAKDSAKAAGKILVAAFVLMSCGVYTVAAAPSDKFEDPNEYKIEIPEVREEIVAEPAALLPMPDLFLAGFLDATPDEQKVAFESALEDLEQKGFEAMPDVTSWDDAPWWSAYDLGPARAWNLLQFAIHHREPFAFTLPTDEEFSTWCAQFVPVETPEDVTPEHLVNWAGWEADEQLRQFEALLQLLEDAGVEEGRRRKDWKKAVRPWQDLFVHDRQLAWDKLWQAYHLLNNPVGWDVPTDEQIGEALRLKAMDAEATPEPVEIPPEVDPFEAEGGAK
jgi:hypothetical protein